MSDDRSIRAALFDVDGTLVDQRVWKGLFASAYVNDWGVRWHYARALPRLLYLKMNRRYETRFRDRWVRGLARLLTGLAVEDTEDMAEWIAGTFLADVYRDDVIARLQAHRAQGHVTVLVSTMFPVVLRAIARQVGADEVIGSRPEILSGRLTGRLTGESCVGPRKRTFAAAFLAEHYLDVKLDDCAAYADSYSDVPLLEAAGKPCAVYPDEGLRQVAEMRGWEIIG